MAVKTGYLKSELEALRATITQKGDALIADLPREPLWELSLTCCCDRCIDPDVLPLLRKTAPPDMTERMISQYFGGVSAVSVDQSDESRYEARVMLTHVLAHLGRIVIQPRDVARKMYLRMSYVDVDYRVPCLLETGVLTRLPCNVQADMRAYLIQVAQCAIATKSTRLTDVLCYLSLFAGALPEVVEMYRNGPPRRHLRFWTSIAGSAVSSDRSGAFSDDFQRLFHGMNQRDKAYMLATLEDPKVEQLIERYAYRATDPLWLQYLSNLLDWRGQTILATRYSDRKGRLD